MSYLSTFEDHPVRRCRKCRASDIRAHAAFCSDTSDCIGRPESVPKTLMAQVYNLIHLAGKSFP